VSRKKKERRGKGEGGSRRFKAVITATRMALRRRLRCTPDEEWDCQKENKEKRNPITRDFLSLFYLVLPTGPPFFDGGKKRSQEKKGKGGKEETQTYIVSAAH